MRLLRDSDGILSDIRYILFYGWAYRPLMKLAHRMGWHHMKVCYPDGDTMLLVPTVWRTLCRAIATPHESARRGGMRLGRLSIQYRGRSWDWKRNSATRWP
jgi:hypothetical protein